MQMFEVPRRWLKYSVIVYSTKQFHVFVAFSQKPEEIAAAELLSLEMTSRGHLILSLIKHRDYLIISKQLQRN